MKWSIVYVRWGICTMLCKCFARASADLRGNFGVGEVLYSVYEVGYSAYEVDYSVYDVA